MLKHYYNCFVMYKVCLAGGVSEPYKYFNKVFDCFEKIIFRNLFYIFKFVP